MNRYRISPQGIEETSKEGMTEMMVSSAISEFEFERTRRLKQDPHAVMRANNSKKRRKR